VRAFAAVNGAAIERAAIDIPERVAVGVGEVAVDAGLGGAAKRLANNPTIARQHHRGPLGSTEEPPRVRVAKPRLHRWQILTGERAKADISRGHNKMIARPLVRCAFPRKSWTLGW